MHNTWQMVLHNSWSMSDSASINENFFLSNTMTSRSLVSFSGGFYNPHTRVWFRWSKYLTYITYAYAGLADIEFSHGYDFRYMTKPNLLWLVLYSLKFMRSDILSNRVFEIIGPFLKWENSNRLWHYRIPTFRENLEYPGMSGNSEIAWKVSERSGKWEEYIGQEKYNLNCWGGWLDWSIVKSKLSGRE